MRPAHTKYIKRCGHGRGKLDRAFSPFECGRYQAFGSLQGGRGHYFIEMCSGSEAGSYAMLIDFVYHSTLGFRVIKKKGAITHLNRSSSPKRCPSASITVAITCPSPRQHRG